MLKKPDRSIESGAQEALKMPAVCGVALKSEIVTIAEMQSETRKVVAQIIEDPIPDGISNKWHFGMALVGAATLGNVETPERVIELASSIAARSSISTASGSLIAAALTGDDSSIKRNISSGLDLLKSHKSHEIISGWALLSGSATTPAQVHNAFESIKNSDQLVNLSNTHSVSISGAKDIFASIALKAMAIVANDQQSSVIYIEASELFEKPSVDSTARNYALEAMAMSAPAGDSRQVVFNLGLEMINLTHQMDKKSAIGAMALSAQTPEEKSLTFQTAKSYMMTESIFKEFSATCLLVLAMLSSDHRATALKMYASTIY